MKAAGRARVILEYLADNEVAGTPAIIHHQLELFRDADWSRDTTQRRLQDFEAVGYVEYLPDVGKGYYRISKAGAFRADHGISDEELTDIIGTASP